MVRIVSKEIVKRIKERQKTDQKSNVTFRLNNLLMDAFRKKCERGDISMNAAVEELVRQFIEE